MSFAEDNFHEYLSVKQKPANNMYSYKIRLNCRNYCQIIKIKSDELVY